MKLPHTLYWQCRKLFLKCAQFEESRRLSDFCNPQEELYYLVEDIVQEKTWGRFTFHSTGLYSAQSVNRNQK